MTYEEAKPLEGAYILVDGMPLRVFEIFKPVPESHYPLVMHCVGLRYTHLGCKKFDHFIQGDEILFSEITQISQAEFQHYAENEFSILLDLVTDYDWKEKVRVGDVLCFYQHSFTLGNPECQHGNHEIYYTVRSITKYYAAHMTLYLSIMRLREDGKWYSERGTRSRKVDTKLEFKIVPPEWLLRRAEELRSGYAEFPLNLRAEDFQMFNHA